MSGSVKLSGKIIGVLLLCIGFLTQVQARYPVVAAMGPNVIINNPLHLPLDLGDQVLVVRDQNGKDIVLAIAIVDKFQGQYCRARITEMLVSVTPHEGDFLMLKNKAKRKQETVSSMPPPANDEAALLAGTSTSSTPVATTAPSVERTPAYRPSSSPTVRDNSLIIGAFSGFGQSNFKGAELYPANGTILPSQSFYAPLGLQIRYRMNRIEFGTEFSYAIAPFEFKESDAASGEEIYTDQLKQMHLGAMVRFNFLPSSSFTPYGRAGAGIYTGDFVRSNNLDYSGADADTPAEEAVSELKTGMGFNIGGGIAYRAWFIEAIYHGVNRTHVLETVDESGNPATEEVSFDANNWAVQIGLQFSL